MTSRHYVLFALVVPALLVSAMQSSMISVGLRNVIVDLNAPLRWVSWIVTIYTLMQAIATPITGKLSDELGRRTVFAGGIVLFIVACVVCATAPNVYVLILGRLIQGAAGGSLIPSAYGIIADNFPAQQRTQALGMVTAIFPIGGSIGPSIGGVLVDNFTWRAVFVFAIPVLVLVLLALFLIYPGQSERKPQPIDYKGSLLLAAAVSGVIYSLTELSIRGHHPDPILVAGGFIVSMVGFVLFIRRESSVDYPIVDLQLLRRPVFAITNAMNFCYGVPLYGLLALTPLYAQTAYGMSSGEAGALVTPRGIATMLTTIACAAMLPRLGYRRPIVAGLVAMAISFLVLSLGIHNPGLGSVGVSNFVFLAFIIGLGAVGIGLLNPPASTAALELEPSRIATITGLRGMFQALGGTLGVQTVVLVASRSGSTAKGLEMSFLGIGILSIATTVFTLWIPDRVTHGVGQQGRPVVAASVPDDP